MKGEELYLSLLFTMRTLNSSNILVIGSTVVLKKQFVNGGVILPAGIKGIVQDVERATFADLGLFNIKIITFRFGNYIFSVGEDVIREYIKKQ